MNRDVVVVDVGAVAVDVVVVLQGEHCRKSDVGRALSVVPAQKSDTLTLRDEQARHLDRSIVDDFDIGKAQQATGIVLESCGRTSIGFFLIPHPCHLNAHSS